MKHECCEESKLYVEFVNSEWHLPCFDLGYYDYNPIVSINYCPWCGEKLEVKDEDS